MPLIDRAERVSEWTEILAERLGHRLVRAFHLVALLVIGATIVWSAATDYVHIIRAGHPTLHDVMLLFIYLELVAMVGIYFQTNELPVEFLLYVAITVITRSLISVDDLSDVRVVILTGAVLVLTGAVVLLRYGAHRFRTGGAGGRGGAAEATDLPD